MLVPMIAQCTQVQNTCDSTPLIRTRGGVRQLANRVSIINIKLLENP